MYTWYIIWPSISVMECGMQYMVLGMKLYPASGCVCTYTDCYLRERVETNKLSTRRCLGKWTWEKQKRKTGLTWSTYITICYEARIIAIGSPVEWSCGHCQEGFGVLRFHQKRRYKCKVTRHSYSFYAIRMIQRGSTREEGRCWNILAMSTKRFNVGWPGRQAQGVGVGEVGRRRSNDTLCAIRFQSVSYTHLTLPTIYSV